MYGRLYCLPIANETLLEEKVVALRPATVDTIPPARASIVPNGRRNSAACGIPSS